MTKKYLTVIAGTQYGSEGKGHVTDQTIRQALQKHHHVTSVRVGGPNAGHCVIDPKTQHRYAFRTIPVGAIHDLHCYIAPGSEIDLTVLEDEIRELVENGRTPRVTIDGQATLLSKRHIKQERESDLNDRTGSTAKGIGAARAERIWRKAYTIDQATKNPHTNQTLERINKIAEQAHGGWVQVHSGDPDEPTYWEQLEKRMWEQKVGTYHVVIEGTQGYWLGMHAGHYPQSTSNNARPIDFIAQAGLHPWEWETSAIGVTRTNPIRVAGNSGPLKGETNWDELGQDAEYTTVTQKQRRVGAWDPEATQMAVKRAGIQHIALTMVDKILPEVAGMHGPVTNQQLRDTMPNLWNLILNTERELTVEISMVTTSPDTALFIPTIHGPGLTWTNN